MSFKTTLQVPSLNGRQLSRHLSNAKTTFHHDTSF